MHLTHKHDHIYISPSLSAELILHQISCYERSLCALYVLGSRKNS